MHEQYILMKSKNKDKKYSLKIIQTDGHEKVINFGASGY
jgi:hypothetical protein